MKGIRRYFQWLVGDDQGKVVELIDITQEDGEYFYNFEDGESCNLSYICAATNDKNMLRGKAMVEVPGPYNAWKFEEIKTGSFTTADDEHVVVPPLEDILNQDKDGNISSAVGTKRLIPPKDYHIIGMPLPSLEEYLRRPKEEKAQSSGVMVTIKNEVPEEPVKPVTSTPKQEERKPNVNEHDPVYILVKTCKKHDTEISMTVNISLPSKSTYNFAKAEFEDGGEKFIDMLADTLDMTEIEKSIKSALKQAYESQSAE
jgi:hypothetical protein